MNLGIIGAGRLGTALGDHLGLAGHTVRYGTGALGSNSEAVEFAETVILAVPFGGIARALADLGDLGGRVLWSCVNALQPDSSGLAVGFDNSGAEEVARRARGARVVAAIPPFASAIAAPSLAYDAHLPPTVFLCAEDAAAKETVAGLVRDLGGHPIDAGPLTAARYVEPAMMLLISLAYADPPRDLGLRLLER
jgi:8-hydroxy-5-deazaflavin:NADPH oxidoreductase